MMDKLRMIIPSKTPEDRMHNDALESMKLEQHTDFCFIFVGESMLHESVKRTLLIPKGTTIYSGMDEAVDLNDQSSFF